MYYGILNKFGGMFLGVCFVILFMYKGMLFIVIFIINLFMGNINIIYVVLVKDFFVMVIWMEFNVYSYESDWVVGLELWSN